MGRFEFDLGVIGGGAAGLTVTAGAARLGVRTLLVEREDRLGGDCLHYGCVPSKTLIKTASVYHQLARLEEFGLPPVDRPPVVFSHVRRRIRSVIDTVQQHDSVERFCKLGARVIFGKACFSDLHTVEVEGKKYAADKWVIATGSSAAAVPVPGLDETGFLSNRELFSLDRLPESLLVIGGGPIAIEMAQAFNRLGSTVHVVQRSARILSREDDDMAELVQNVLAAEGIVFHCNTRLLRVSRKNGLKCVHFKDNTGCETTICASEILVALGRSANVTELGLKAIGVKHDRRGIKVDSRLRTSHKHIFAAGDVTGAHQFTHAAGYEGGVVISNAVFRLPRKASYRWLPWCTYCDPELAGMGMNEKAAQAAGINYRVWAEEFKDNDRALAENSGNDRIKLLLDDREHPIGIQIMGMHAGDLLAEWIAVTAGKVKLTTLAAAVHPYPTLAEINKRVAGNVLAEKIFSSRMKKALAFFFNTRGQACEQ